MDDLTPEQLRALTALMPVSLLRALEQPEPAQTAIDASYDHLRTTLAAIARFVPAPVADGYLADPAGAQMTGVYLNGSVLCASIPDFNVLSTRLSHEGRRGSELLSDVVRQLFSALLDEVYACGGGLIKFNGAGLTAFFDADRLGPEHSTLAAAAALHMQARMAAFDAIATRAGAFRLQLRIGVQRGRIFAAEVGNEHRREFIVAGRAISRAVVAQNSAAPGEVIVVGETHAALPQAHIHQLHDDLYVLDAIPPPALPVTRPAWDAGPPSLASVRALLTRIVALQAYVPVDLGAPAQLPSGEFRPVTVMFQDFYALSQLLNFLELPALAEQDPTIVGQVANLFYTRTQTIVEQFGGSINTVDTATFGNRCMAIFGAPTVHEDDPERAVRAALALKASLPETSRHIAMLLRNWAAQHPDQQLLLRALNHTLRQRTGIASGTLFAGVIGTPQRCAYTVMGETIGLAARLMMAADNGAILLSSMVRYAVRREISTQPKPTINISDTSSTIPVFQVGDAHDGTDVGADALPHAVDLVGRSAELAQIRAVTQAALAPGERAGQVLAVVGEPGIGKSRLVDEGVRIAQTVYATVTVISVTCESYEQTTPYAVVARLLRQMIAQPLQSARDDQAQAVQRQLDALVPQWSRFAPLLATLLNLPIPDTELTSALTAEQRRDRLHDLVTMLCFALAQRAPLVLVVDDLQWADASSYALISRIASELSGQPLLLTLAYRASANVDAPWRELAYTTSIELRELALDASEALVRTLLDGALPHELLPLIVRARGTPFFLEETVSYLLRSGLLRRTRTGTWMCTVPVDSSMIPSQIEQLLAARLDQLDPDTRALTQISAVIGQHVALPLLDAVYGASSARSVRVLLDEQIFVPHEKAEASYEFRHALLRDVAYERMLFAHRRELHAQVAAAIEQLYAETLDDQRVILAQHYLRAEQHDRAFPHFVRAAQQAQARYANSEAIALYREAIRAAPWRDTGNTIADLATAIPLYESLGDVLALTGEYAAARDTYEWLLGALKTSADPAYTVPIAALQRKLGSTFEQQGNLDAALQWFGDAAASIDEALPSPAATLERARIQSDTGWVHFRRNNLDAAQECLSDALARVDADAHPDEQARILNRLGGVAWTRGDMEQAQAYVERSLAASEKSGDLVGQAWALNNLGILTETQGHNNEAIDYSLRAINIVEPLGSLRMMAMIKINIGWSLYNLEEFGRSRQYFTESIEGAVEVHDTYFQMLSLLNLGRVLTSVQHWSEAQDVTQQSLFIALQLNISPLQLEAYTALAEIALYQGNIDKVLAYRADGLGLIDNVETEEYGRFQRLEAKLAFAQGDSARAIELLHTNEALFMRLHNVPEARRTHKLLSEITIL